MLDNRLDTRLREWYPRFRQMPAAVELPGPPTSKQRDIGRRLVGEGIYAPLELTLQIGRAPQLEQHVIQWNVCGTAIIAGVGSRACVTRKPDESGFVNRPGDDAAARAAISPERESERRAKGIKSYRGNCEREAKLLGHRIQLRISVSSPKAKFSGELDQERRNFLDLLRPAESHKSPRPPPGKYPSDRLPYTNDVRRALL
jgi:hypothetical protein